MTLFGLESASLMRKLPRLKQSVAPERSEASSANIQKSLLSKPNNPINQNSEILSHWLKK
jgi:hypothetical protein